MKTRTYDPVIDAAMASAELEFDGIVEKLLDAYRPERAVQFDLVGQAVEMESTRLELMYLFEHEYKRTGEYPRTLATDLISLNARLSRIYESLKFEGERQDARQDAGMEAEAARVLQNFAARTVRNKVQ